MKTIKCSQVGGGTCTAEFTAATPEEMMKMLGDHAKVAHADMMAKSTPESMKEWGVMFRKVWDATPLN